MNWKNTATRYGNLSIGLHWLMLLLIITVYCSMELRGLFPKGSDGRTLMKLTHFTLGMTIFGLVWIRLIARLGAPKPRIQPTPHALQDTAARLMHWALYALMIVTPMLGWLYFSAEGKSVPLFGLELPPLLDKNHDLAENLEHWHIQIAQLGYWLIGLHAAAALLHHHVLRDNTLRLMLPRRR